MDPASAWHCRIFQNLKGSAEAEWLLSVFFQTAARRPFVPQMLSAFCWLFTLLFFCLFLPLPLFFVLILSKHLLLLPAVYQPAFWVPSGLHRYYCVYSPLSFKAGKPFSFFIVIYLTPFFLFSSYKHWALNPVVAPLIRFWSCWRSFSVLLVVLGFQSYKVAVAD